MRTGRADQTAFGLNPVKISPFGVESVVNNLLSTIQDGFYQSCPAPWCATWQRCALSTAMPFLFIAPFIARTRPLRRAFGPRSAVHNDWSVTKGGRRSLLAHWHPSIQPTLPPDHDRGGDVGNAARPKAASLCSAKSRYLASISPHQNSGRYSLIFAFCVFYIFICTKKPQKLKARWPWISIRCARRPSWTAAMPVVPLPANGSATRSPGSVRFCTSHLMQPSDF